MSFVTTTLRDTVVNAPKAGGMVTVKAVLIMILQIISS